LSQLSGSPAHTKAWSLFKLPVVALGIPIAMFIAGDCQWLHLNLNEETEPSHLIAMRFGRLYPVPTQLLALGAVAILFGNRLRRVPWAVLVGGFIAAGLAAIGLESFRHYYPDACRWHPDTRWWHGGPLWLGLIVTASLLCLARPVAARPAPSDHSEAVRE